MTKEPVNWHWEGVCDFPKMSIAERRRLKCQENIPPEGNGKMRGQREEKSYPPSPPLGEDVTGPYCSHYFDISDAKAGKSIMTRHKKNACIFNWNDNGKIVAAFRYAKNGKEHMIHYFQNGRYKKNRKHPWDLRIRVPLY